MTRGRHSLAPPASKKRRVAFLAAPLATCAVIGVGMALSDGGTASVDLSGSASSDIGAAAPIDGRAVTGTSRDFDRRVATRQPAAVPSAPPKVAERLWTTTDLNLRATADESAKVLGEVPAINRIGITGQRSNGFAQVVVRHDGSRTIAWVTAEYLVRAKPEDPAQVGLSDAPCPDTSVEYRLTSGAVRVHRAVCHAFPQITQYGGWDAHGEHSSGKALDIMTSDVKLGYEIADFLQAHASELDLYDIIWRQHIWTPERASEGWRSMPDRGSATANHYDHVHVSVN